MIPGHSLAKVCIVQGCVRGRYLLISSGWLRSEPSDGCNAFVNGAELK